MFVLLVQKLDDVEANVVQEFLAMLGGDNFGLEVSVQLPSDYFEGLRDCQSAVLLGAIQNVADLSDVPLSSFLPGGSREGESGPDIESMELPRVGID